MEDNTHLGGKSGILGRIGLGFLERVGGTFLDVLDGTKVESNKVAMRFENTREKNKNLASGSESTITDYESNDR